MRNPIPSRPSKSEKAIEDGCGFDDLWSGLLLFSSSLKFIIPISYEDCELV